MFDTNIGIKYARTIEFKNGDQDEDDIHDQDPYRICSCIFNSIQIIEFLFVKDILLKLKFAPIFLYSSSFFSEINDIFFWRNLVARGCYWIGFQLRTRYFMDLRVSKFFNLLYFESTSGFDDQYETIEYSKYVTIFEEYEKETLTKWKALDPKNEFHWHKRNLKRPFVPLFNQYNSRKLAKINKVASSFLKMAVKTNYEENPSTNIVTYT